MKIEERIRLLIDIILDPNAEDHEKDDAALDLAEYDDEKALAALIKASKNPTYSDQFALENYGEAIGEMWARKNQFDLQDYKLLHPTARYSLRSIIALRRPEWIEKFGLKDD